MTDFPRSQSAVLQALRVAVLATDEDWGAEFVRAVSANGAQDPSVQVHGHAVDVHMMQRPVDADGPVDGAVLLVRYLDGLSLRTIRDLLGSLSAPCAIPVAAMLLREEGEVDFKMSCCSCGQKLWIPDADEGKRGRCPNCRKAFVLPSQESYLRDLLQLAASAPVVRGRLGDASACRFALPELVAYIAEAAPDELAASDEPATRIPEVPKTDTDVVEPI